MIAFTLVEILMAIGILGLVLTAIYSSWTAILRASRVGLEAAASVQRSRIAIRTIEDALTCAQSFQANLDYYEFIAENGNEATLSFVARLPQSFPRSSKFELFPVRRVTFFVDSGKDLLLQQSPILTEIDEDEKKFPLLLARNVQGLEMEFWDNRQKDWVDEWRETNQIPKVVRLTLKIADKPNSPSRAVQEIIRIISIPSQMVAPVWQAPMGIPGMAPGQPPPGGIPGPGGVLPGGAVPNPMLQQPGMMQPGIR
jgi:type II secretion system protein J